MKKYYLGIDTSAYTTSIAVVDKDRNIIFDNRKVLKVESRKKGLRQQDAVFQHLNNIPDIIGDLTENIDVEKLDTVSVSAKPRNAKNSYMPVFVVGKGQAYIIAKMLNLHYKEFSHQEGHIGAAMMSNDLIYKDKFLAFHLSGGTTEVLLVNNKEKNFKIDIIGGSLDISVGQLIDRIGVQLGYRFPCGKKLDEISKNSSIIPLKYPIKTKGTWANFSGMENFFINLIQHEKYGEEQIIKTMFYTIGLMLEKLILGTCKKTNINTIVLIGGVASNSIIKEYLLGNLRKKGINVFLTNNKLCTDNGVGVAYLGTIKDGH
ncbi:MAG TPA: hypothetical protein VK071_03380 [Tissierellales bacterium]|nr:hypothetical protein [Tissierellales bacterium]